MCECVCVCVCVCMCVRVCVCVCVCVLIPYMYIHNDMSSLLDTQQLPPALKVHVHVCMCIVRITWENSHFSDQSHSLVCYRTWLIYVVAWWLI